MRTKLKLLLASLIAVIGLGVLSGMALAGYAPANRPTYQCITPTNCPGADHVVFNSFTNAPNYGDERAFFDAKDASITGPGGFQDKLNGVHDGQKLLMRVYVHNNANPKVIGTKKATAKNTRLLVLLPKANLANQTAAAAISASNANPASVSDTVDMSGSDRFTLTLDKSSAPQITHRINGQGNWVTENLPGVSYTSDQSMVANMGDWKGCFEYSAVITFVAVVHMPTTVTPAYACNLLSVDVDNAHRSVNASVDYTATGGAVFKSTTFAWGDNASDTVNGTQASHTYADNQDRTITATLKFDVGGTEKTAACSKQISFTKPQTPPSTPPVKSLPNTGVGNALGLFAGASLLAGLGHFVVSRRRA